ncbi:MAG: hypothetical protein L6Q71_05370 [Planctomycetes bacterium]|nr:hypothetical protein [Planctomycetota bacterium]NUQ35817.1 hypothetical protein [Planctomycetaceae bacterium]
MKRFVVMAFALSLAMFATSVLAQRASKRIGKPCPEIPLEGYMIQGDAITQADMYGRVVYIDFYQPG